MCGIAGFANIKNSNFYIKDEQLDILHKSIEHRGPDGFGIWKSEKFEVAFVHRRLAIVDLSSGGHQPMLDDQKSVVISFNGEIYNYEQIRKELSILGYNFKSRSDTEVIIYAYKHWGIGCLEKLEGMFAFSLFDLSKNELFLVRDRIGVKPIYFSLQDNILSFASEIKALFTLDFVKKNLNTQSMYHYLSYLVTPAPLTIYQDIYKLPAGFYLKLDSNKNISFVNWYDLAAPYFDTFSSACPKLAKTLSTSAIESYLDKKSNLNISNYFDGISKSLALSDNPEGIIVSKGLSVKTEQFYVDKLLDLLDESVKKRLMSDVPLGVFLSGGVDSSLLLGLMARHTDNLRSFNISFDVGGDYNEQKYARQVANLFGSKHTELVVGEREAFEFYSTMIHHQDEPLADCVNIPLYYVSQSLRDSGARVVLIGEGADELFFGYSMYAKYLRASNILSKFNFLPESLKKLIGSGATKFFSSKYSFLDLLNNWSKSRSIFYSGAIAYPESMKKKFFKFQDFPQDPIISQIYPGINQGFDSYEYLNYHVKNFNNSGLYEKNFANLMLYLELKNRLPELLLMRADKMTMAASIEGREPFLDHSLVEFAFSIPQDLKYKNGITKYILKKAAETILPKNIIYRKKIGFAAPTKLWFKNGKYFRPYFEELLVSKRDSIKLYFDIKFIENMLVEHKSGKHNHADQLWTLQNLFSLDCFGYD